MLKKLIMLCILGALVWMGYNWLEDKKSPSTQNTVGQAVPATTFNAQGPKLVYFTASWCPSCQENKPLLEGLPMPLSVVVYRDQAAVDPDLQKNAAQVVNDEQGTVANEWQVAGVPVLMLVDGNNVIKWRHEGKLTTEIVEQGLKPAINQLTAPAPTEPAATETAVPAPTDVPAAAEPTPPAAETPAPAS